MAENNHIGAALPGVVAVIVRTAVSESRRHEFDGIERPIRLKCSNRARDSAHWLVPVGGCSKRFSVS